MTCGSCEAKVKSSLLMLPNVTEVEVSKDNQSATITMDKHIALLTLQHALDKKIPLQPQNTMKQWKKQKAGLPHTNQF